MGLVVGRVVGDKSEIKYGINFLDLVIFGTFISLLVG